MPMVLYPALAGAAGWLLGFFSSDGIKNLLWFAVIAVVIVLALGVL